MPVAGECLRDCLVAHDQKGKTVRQRPVLVRAFREEIHAAPEKPGVGRNDLDAPMVDDGAIEGDKIRPVFRMRVGIGKFSQHPLGCDQPERGVPRSRESLPMTFLP